MDAWYLNVIIISAILYLVIIFSMLFLISAATMKYPVVQKIWDKYSLPLTILVIAIMLSISSIIIGLISTICAFILACCILLCLDSIIEQETQYRRI